MLMSRMRKRGWCPWLAWIPRKFGRSPPSIGSSSAGLGQEDQRRPLENHTIWEESMNTLLKSTVAVSLFSLLAISANAQGDNTAGRGGPPVLRRDLAWPRFGTGLRVTSPAFLSGGTIDERYTPNGENVSPSLDWSKPPAGTQSLAVFVADAGVNLPEPIMHWIVYNIPST